MRRRPWPRRQVDCLVRCPLHTRLFLDAAGQLANNPSIQGEAWRVLLLLLSLVDGENRAVVPTAELAARLTVPRQNIWPAMTQLAQAGCLRRVSPGTYQVSPQAASRRHEAREDGPQPHYLRLWQTDALRQLAADETLHASDLRLFGKVLSAMRWSNVVRILPPQWGQEMGVARQTVGRSLKVLLAKGVLMPDFRGRPDHYTLSFQYGYRGHMRYLSRLRRQEHALHQLQRLAGEA